MERRTTNNGDRIRKLVELSVLTAIVLFLALFGTLIKIPFLTTSINLVLIPIVLGSVVFNPAAGAWLGLVYGVTYYLAGGVFGGDAFTTTLFQAHPFFTFLICSVKSTAAGFVSGIIYRAMKKKNESYAVFCASVATPVVNTGLFILLAFTVSDTLNASFVPEGRNIFYFLLIVCAGINFLLELLINVIFAPALYRVIKINREESKHV